MGDVPEVLPGGEAPRLDATPGEIARGIETNGCWMVLKYAETDPQYSALLDEALDEILPVVADREGKATKREAFIFLTAPNATTPLHTDPEENFLLQVKAKKQIEIGKWPTPEAEHAHLERYYGGGHRNIDEMPPDWKRFILEPGDGGHSQRPPLGEELRRGPDLVLHHLQHAAERVPERGLRGQRATPQAPSLAASARREPGQRPRQGRAVADHAARQARGSVGFR